MANNWLSGQKLSFNNVELLRNERLGRGSYGFVCKAQCDQLICAAKIIYDVLCQAHESTAPDPGREHRQPHRRFLSEIEFLKHVNHPNIVQYLGTYEDSDSGDLVLLMELMDESLTHFLESSPGDIPYHTQVNLSYDIAQALAFLHANGIIHRDLSSNNVLLAGTKAKVTDFGMSKFTERTISMTLSPGTPAFMSPEALNQPPVYTEKLDTFSFGVLLVQMVTRRFPEPTERFEAQELVNPRTNQTIQAQVPVPEVERRRGNISLIQHDHPLLPMALDCLKDRDQERPSSQELCGRLYALKRSDRYVESSQQDPAHIIRQLQAQDQLHQVEIREKTSQITVYQDELEVLTNELDGRERQLRSLNEKFVANEQSTSTLQQELVQRDREIGELRELLATKDQEIRAVLKNTQQPAKPECRSIVQSGEERIELSWESLPYAPVKIGAVRSSVAVANDRVYFESCDAEVVHSFNYSNQQWSVLPRHPIDGFTIVSIKNTLTTVGGASGLLSLMFSNKLYSYENGKWIESLPRMPTKRCTPGAVYTDNTLIVVGGENLLLYFSTVEILNTTDRQWCSVSSLPLSTSQPSICTWDNNIILHPGLTFYSDKSSVWKCSLTSLVHSKPNSEVWERIASLPVRWSTLTSVHGHLIAVGGEDSRDVNQYNETSDSWTVISQMPVAGGSCVIALLSDNKLLVVGGYGAARSVDSEVHMATITQQLTVKD